MNRNSRRVHGWTSVLNSTLTAACLAALSGGCQVFDPDPRAGSTAHRTPATAAPAGEGAMAETRGDDPRRSDAGVVATRTPTALTLEEAGSPAEQPVHQTTAPQTRDNPRRVVRVPQPVDDAIEAIPATANVARVTFAEEGSDFDPCVSPDGARLVFASTQHRATADIYIKRTDSRVVTQLTNDPAEDAMPKISPDGERIAFASNRAGSWDIYVMPIGGGKAVQITSDLADEIHPSWSPDGTQLVFGRLGEATGRWEMWTVAIHNPSVAHFIGFGLFPEWCPVAATGENGADKILFQLGRERGRRAFGVWTLDVANGVATNATEIAGSINTALINPAWSPDGQWIVYAEVPVAQEDMQVYGSSVGQRPDSASLWMISAEGEGKVRLTAGAGVSLAPTWGNDNRMFYVSDRSGFDNVWSMDLSPAIAAAQAVSPQPHLATSPGAGDGSDPSETPESVAPGND